MDFALNDEQRMLVDTVRSFIAEELAPLEDAVEATGALEPETAKAIHAKAKALGLYAMNIPEKFGGGGLSAVDHMLAEEQFGRTTDILVRRAFGNVYEMLLECRGAQIERWLKPTVRGERVCSIAITEPGAGSDAAAIKTRARRDGNGWRITGSKHFISDGAVSDFFLVTAVTDPSAGARGISMFLVDKGLPGFTIGRDQPMMGLRGTSHVELFFDETPVEAVALLGPEGGGLRLALTTLGRVRLAQVGARAIGKATLVLEKTIAYARERKQFGKSLGEFQMVQQMIADFDRRDQLRPPASASRRLRSRRRPRRARSHRHGQGQRRRDARARRRPGGADLWRHGILQGSADRTLLSRRAHLPHLRRRLRDPSLHHRPLRPARRRLALRHRGLTMARAQFMSADEAACLLRDGDTVALIGGGGGLIEAASLFAAVERRFLAQGRPRDLALVHSLGIGDRKTRGLNCLAHEGLVRKVTGGHWVWSPKMQELARTNRIEAYVLPGGVLMQLYREIGAGRPGLLSHVGLGTFVDPRLDGGRMNEAAKETPVEVMTVGGDEFLFYKSFPVHVALLRGTFADDEGNVSLAEEAANLDIQAAALAAHNSGGKVIVEVRERVRAGALPAHSVAIPGAWVDAIVVAPDQTMTYDIAYDPAMAGVTRLPPHVLDVPALDERQAIARRARAELQDGMVVNFGFGVPDAVAALVAEDVRAGRYLQTIEHGVYGGELLTGLVFGFSRNASAMIDAPTQFDFYSGGGLDIAFLGFGQVDAAGNVNASKLGGVPVGPGGFIDIAQNARKVVFCGTFDAKGAKLKIGAGRLEVVSQGALKKFVREVDQITFSGAEALKRGQEVLYVTERAVFLLTERGPTLIEIAPGADLDRDVLAGMAFAPALAEPLALMPAASFG